MKKHNVEDLFFKLLHGNLGPEEEEMIISELEKAGINRKEINSIMSVDKLLDSAPLPEPTEKMDRRFYAMLNDEKRKSLPVEPDIVKPMITLKGIMAPGIRIAAGIALFLLGWFSSGWLNTSSLNRVQLTTLNTEIGNLKETLILTMMQQNSTVERIKAVNMVDEFETPASPIIESLLNILNNDSNDNVRLLALESLTRYTSIPEVRDGLVLTIAKQTSPMIQLRLIEVMLALKERRAAPEFEKILQNTQVNYIVKGKINNAVSVLL
jgi:hypothetical protein